MGRPAPGIDLQIIDDEGNIVDSNTEGDIAVRIEPHSHPRGFSVSIAMTPNVRLPRAELTGT